MDQKTKYRIADRNKERMLQDALAILSVLHCTQTPDEIKDAWRYIKKDDHHLAALLTAKGEWIETNEIKIDDVRDVLDRGILYEYAPDPIQDLCNIVIAKRNELGKKSVPFSLML